MPVRDCSNSLLGLTPGYANGPGGLPGVEARDYVDDTAIETVVEGVGEAREEGPPEAHRNLWKRLGKFCNEINDLFEGVHEGVAEARTLGVVPVAGYRNVVARLPAEADRHG